MKQYNIRFEIKILQSSVAEGFRRSERFCQVILNIPVMQTFDLIFGLVTLISSSF